MEIKIGWVFFWIFLIVQLLSVFNRLPKLIKIISNILATLLAIWIFIFGPIYFFYLTSKEPLDFEYSLLQESIRLEKSIKREDTVISLYNMKGSRLDKLYI